LSGDVNLISAARQRVTGSGLEGLADFCRKTVGVSALKSTGVSVIGKSAGKELPLAEGMSK
jgi:hypothetical protein